MEKYKNKNYQTNYENQPRKLSRKKLARFGVVATTFFMLGSHKDEIIKTTEDAFAPAVEAVKAFRSHNSTVDYTKSEVKIEGRDAKYGGFHNSEIDISKYKKIGEAGQPEESYFVNLDEGRSIRASDISFAGDNPEPLQYSTLAEAKEPLSFNINYGEIYQGGEGRIIARIENFEKTSDGKETGINIDTDADGWVAVDAKLDITANEDSPKTE